MHFGIRIVYCTDLKAWKDEEKNTKNGKIRNVCASTLSGYNYDDNTHFV